MEYWVPMEPLNWLCLATDHPFWGAEGLPPAIPADGWSTITRWLFQGRYRLPTYPGYFFRAPPGNPIQNPIESHSVHGHRGMFWISWHMFAEVGDKPAASVTMRDLCKDAFFDGAVGVVSRFILKKLGKQKLVGFTVWIYNLLSSNMHFSPF